RAGLATAIELEPDNPELYTLRGQVYLNVYEWDKSLADFNTAIELAPEYADAYFQRGVLYYSILQTGQELRQEALGDFQHYLDLAPEGHYADQAREYTAKIEAEQAAMAEQRRCKPTAIDLRGSPLRQASITGGPGVSSARQHPQHNPL